MKITGFIFSGIFAFVLLTTTAFGSTNEYRAIWVDAFGPGYRSAVEVTTLMNDLRAMNMNAVIPEVRARANAYYNGSPYELKASGITPSDFDPLADLIAKGHDTSGGKQRIEIHAWMVTYKTNNSAQASPWMHKNYLGTNNPAEFDPGHPQVQERIYNVAMDIVSRYDVDGLNFDYIRYPEGVLGTPSLWGYNDVTVARFNGRYGRTGMPGTNDVLWCQFRRDQVTALMRKVYLNVMAIKPWVKISADTITWSPGPIDDASWTNSRPYNDVLQNWRGWMEEGIIDLNVTMSYFRVHDAIQNEDFYEWSNFAKDRKFNRQLIIGPAFYLNYLSNSLVQMRSTRAVTTNGNTADGIAGYDYGQISIAAEPRPLSDFVNAVTQPSSHDPVTPPIYASRATIPDMPWKSAPTKGHLKGFIAGGHVTNNLDGASLSLSGPVSRSFISDATGFFGSVDLPPGAYTLTASFTNGFSPVLTNFTVAAGLVTTRNIILPVESAPTITTHPVSQAVNPGTNVTFTVAATGTDPLSYQWKWNGSSISGAIATSYTITNVSTNDVGNFSVVVTNPLGTNESSAATLTITLPPVVTGTTLLWKVNQEDRSYFGTNHTERGLAYNPANNNLLFIGRSPTTQIYVLHGDTGAELRTLTLTTNITGGTFALLMLGVADDGAVYAGNLSTANTTPFRLYRWSNDSTSSIPTVAFSGDPGLGNNQRWGDTIDIRGAGTNTQILLGSRFGNIASILTTTNGMDFTATTIAVPNPANGKIGLGLAFGRGDTFWGKTTNNPLYQIAFTLTNGTGIVVRTNAEPSIPNMLVPIGVSQKLDLLAGISWETPDTLKLYDINNSGTLPLLASTNFPTDIANTFFVGSVDFGRDRVYALNANNGIMALRFNFAPVTTPKIIKLSLLPANRFGLWFNAERRPYTVEASPDLNFWNPVTNDIPQDGYLQFDDAATDAVRFYRLRVP